MNRNDKLKEDDLNWYRKSLKASSEQYWELHAENEKLREALKQIDYFLSKGMSMYMSDRRLIANKALIGTSGCESSVIEKD